ncbi:hypothetical protein MYP14_25595 (plasmid) [Rhodococcus pyridinivorans]|uniref:hypothetical protein n=1 Tax=Rhodococcus pyridinivorans TaxID=103816 RepID=UPI0020004DB5|nr:hypothetical protein [Rhodococcus pyridinivorans]UPK66449.1 hypothetical protein MYP14_25595 [Rhodococcus pyridinivorans]
MDGNKKLHECLLPQLFSTVSVFGMAEPNIPDWAIEVDDSESTDTMAVFDFYGPTVNPVPSLGVFLSQRVSTSLGVTLYDPIEVVLMPDRGITRLSPPEARALGTVLGEIVAGAETVRYSPRG